VHAHAWPEVYFPEVGWVPFEPTPQRGMPGAEDYTGRLPQQAQASETEPTESVVPTSTTSTTVFQGPATTAAPPTEVPVHGTIVEPTRASEPNRWTQFAVWITGLGLLWLLVILVAPRIRASAHRRP